MTSMKRWLEHLEDAERLLGLAKARSGDPAKVADCLYEVIVEVTRALMELEKKEELGA